MTESKKYKIRVFGYGYEGGTTLSLPGEVDADRINDEVIHLCVASPKILNFQRMSGIKNMLVMGIIGLKMITFIN